MRSRGVARHNRRVRFALLDDSEAMVLGGKPDGRPVVAGDACATSWGSALLQLSERRRRVDIALYFCDLSLGYMDRMQVSGRSPPPVAPAFPAVVKLNRYGSTLPAGRMTPWAPPALNAH